MKKNLTFIVAFSLMLMSYSTSKLLSDPNAPTGRTGAPKAIVGGSVQYCTSCHGDFSLNVAGGSVVATGLPTTTYSAGQVYNFTIKVSHNAANRLNWGFAIKAVNTVNNDVTGTFSSTNSNATIRGSGSTVELSNAAAPATAAASNYTFLNLKWTAPAAPTANDVNIRFYIVGLAGDASADETGDYVYSTNVSASLSVLPVTLNSFTVKAANENAVNINWETSNEVNTDRFEIENSVNNIDWVKVAAINAGGNSTTLQSYAYTDNKPTLYNADIFYRLKIVDKDGAFKYSSVESIQLKNAGILISNLSAQPLPQGKNGVFKISSNSAKSLFVTATDMSGRLLYRISKMLSTGTNTIEIPGEQLQGAKGMVLIKFSADGFEKVFKQLID